MSTDEQIAETVKIWKSVEEKWKAAHGKCKCGRSITLNDFYFEGVCKACLDEVAMRAEPTLGQIAYEGFMAMVNSRDEKLNVTWWELPPTSQLLWEKSAAAVIDYHERKKLLNQV